MRNGTKGRGKGDRQWDFVQARIDAEFRQRLNRIAQDRDISISELIRRALAFYLEFAEEERIR